jgi:hypothetical protein
LIWIPTSADSLGESSIAAHIERVIVENCGDMLELDDDQAVDLAEAVAAYMEQSHEAGLFVDSGYLVMLASRALASIGNERAAHRLLVFGSGLVRPSEWEVSGGRDIWTLDLRQMTVRAGSTLEIVFFNSLNLVLGAIADVWEPTSGAGVLGLRHVCATASHLLGGGSRKKIEELAEEIKLNCRVKLRQIRDSRGWKQMPSVMNLDIGG